MGHLGRGVAGESLLVDGVVDERYFDLDDLAHVVGDFLGGICGVLYFRVGGPIVEDPLVAVGDISQPAGICDPVGVCHQHLSQLGRAADGRRARVLVVGSGHHRSCGCARQ